MDKDVEKKQCDALDPMTDMAQLGSLILSYSDDSITDLFIDFLQNMEEIK